MSANRTRLGGSFRFRSRFLWPRIFRSSGREGGDAFRLSQLPQALALRDLRWEWCSSAGDATDGDHLARVDAQGLLHVSWTSPPGSRTLAILTGGMVKRWGPSSTRFRRATIRKGDALSTTYRESSPLRCRVRRHG